jgi:flagellar L-ring protein precursor FlgH
MNCTKIIAISLLPSFLSGCYVLDRAMDVGGEPPLTRTQDPTAVPHYQPVTMPMPHPMEPPIPAGTSNSLWQTGAKGFFKDQTAKRVGDLLEVIIIIDDKASMKNEGKQDRTSNVNTGLTAFLGIQGKIFSDPSNIAKGKSVTDSTGKSQIDRTEKIETRLTVTVTQVLPNGNLVIMGRQETRVNFDVREVVLTGVVRRADISSENTIPYQKIAEARISYGGRGQSQDLQQPAWGQQLWNTVMPF